MPGYCRLMRAGDEVPDFELPDQTGTVRSLSGLSRTAPSCCSSTRGAQRVGISRDSVDKQKQFSDTHSFDYPLLADTQGTVADISGVGRGRIGQKLGAPVKRWTFVIGPDRRVEKVLHSETDMAMHADEALAALG